MNRVPTIVELNANAYKAIRRCLSISVTSPAWILGKSLRAIRKRATSTAVIRHMAPRNIQNMALLHEVHDDDIQRQNDGSQYHESVIPAVFLFSVHSLS
jgi:hypothetical protein